ncbi:IPT/TIG domain-containing protein [uncultured Paludibaculum sp.]|uniref:IPT/TIG domain-containing protein n=1 Tax=uncultured Paludibaculum sp. TaxID=1765020 RepID=UPI002AABCEE9|nr:IPT/TIG domain-containing protein [uncultured Paludibaculum sp.]
MKSILIGALLTAPFLQAQYQSLVTTDDGSTLYFTTPLVQRGTSQPAHGKSFRIDAQGLAVQEIRTVDLLQDPPLTITNNYNITGIDVSGDGRITATAAARDCRDSICGSSVNVRTTLRGHGDPVDYNGPARLSQNGRYLAATATGIPRSTGALRRQWDLETGDSWTLPYNSWAPSGRMVANDGTVLAIYEGDVQLLEHGVPRRLTFGSETILDATIDAAGTSVVFTSCWPDPYSTYARVRRIDIASGALSTILEDAVDFSQPSVSNDGSAVIVLSRRQVFYLASDGTGLRQLTNEADGIQTAVLSGDGHVAYALTFGGRLLRIDVAETKVTEILGRTAALSGVPTSGAIGSALVVTGSALDEQDMSVTIGGLAAPLVRAKPGELIFQIPWEATQGSEVPVEIHTQAEFPFVSTLQFPLVVSEVSPDRYGPTLHEQSDWPVTQDAPARGGELIHFYATGLGPVTAPVQTGVPQPADPPATLKHGLGCSYGYEQSSTSVEIRYAGLAPGLIGFYEVALVMPTGVSTGQSHILTLLCRLDLDHGAIGFNLNVPYQP